MATQALSNQDLRERIKGAQALQRQGDLTRAEETWTQIRRDFPDSLAAATALAELQERRGALEDAEATLLSLLDVAPTHAHVLTVARKLKGWEESPRSAPPLRVALTGTGTLSPLADHLRVALARSGFAPAVYASEFDQWAQDLLSPQSPLYAFRPEAVILLLDPAALFPRTLDDPAADAAALAEERQGGIRQIGDLLDALARHAPGATALVHTFALPLHSPLGLRDLSEPDGQRARFAALNDALLEALRSRAPRVFPVDQERVESGYGKAQTRDPRLWYLASVPFAEGFLPHLAREQTRFLRALRGKTRKGVVVDLDNTLWGGVIGEDGLEKIKIGGSAAPGNAFADFQRALDRLRQRGILLALCSKNNEADVWPVFEKHPGMILRREHFAAVRINWQDKARNIAEIAQELNIGLDSLVFLDDNPAERGLVRQQLPMVLTVEMPRDPALYPQTLQNLDVFDLLALTEEDRNRSQLYREQQERRAFEQSSAGDLNAYLHGLEIQVRIAPATAFSLPRIAQLLNKTNQFNVTTRRYTEAQVQALADDPGALVCSLSVADRFGDSGLTGVAIAKKDATLWEIDSFLLSCRVLGRGIERALLTYLARTAREQGATALRGVFIPTPKNAPAAGFFAEQGFAPIGAPEADGTTLWELPLTDTLAYPTWLQVETETT